MAANSASSIPIRERVSGLDPGRSAATAATTTGRSEATRRPARRRARPCASRPRSSHPPRRASRAGTREAAVAAGDGEGRSGGARARRSHDVARAPPLRSAWGRVGLAAAVTQKTARIGSCATRAAAGRPPPRGPASRAPPARTGGPARSPPACGRRAAAPRRRPSPPGERREAAARTAASRASEASGWLASRTTSGAASAPAIRRRSSSSPVRATAGQWMREAGLPSR